MSIFVVVFACIFTYWMTLSPSIKPDDIEITNYMELLSTTQNSIENQVDKVKLEISLNNKASKPLVNENGEYFYTVYIYIPKSYPYLEYKYPNNIHPSEIYIGSDSRTAKKANENLIQNLNISLFNEDSNSDALGFMYNGEKFPFNIEFYFAENEEFENDDNFYVIFAFYENRFGKNLSWSESFMVKNNNFTY